MNTKRIKLCPYIESSHSEAVLGYRCLACKEVEINTKDIDSMPCSSSRYKNCRHYKNAIKKSDKGMKTEHIDAEES